MTIDWLRKQLKNAEQALTEIRRGKRVEVNGEDVTGQWVTMYERLIPRYKRLIEDYQKRSR
jgi:hypothetical protein